MHYRSSEFPIGASFDDVAALLGTKPNSWLRVFLRLATHDEAGHTAAYAEPKLWYRLGTPTELSSGALSARLVWWPHLNGGLFSNFRGEILVVPSEQGSSLSLIGVTKGGEAERNVTVLNRLMMLITTALASGHDLGG